MKEKNINEPQPNSAVTVFAPARLHLGFLDMHGGLGRKFGSIGLALSELGTSITVREAHEVSAVGPSASQAKEYAMVILDKFMLDSGVEICVESAIPEHVGLGSGTQLALAVGMGITKLFNKTISLSDLAGFFHRGARSGIGIGVFENGGFIVDGGRSDKITTPPVIMRAAFPEEWRVILVFDNELKGLNGESESQAFINLPRMGEAEAAQICRHVLMQLMPALYEADCVRFGESISFVQNAIGEYFKSLQGGRYLSPFMADILEKLQIFGATGVGQSSWGPTGFAFYPNETLAYQAFRKIRAIWRDEVQVEFMLCQGRNNSADVLRNNSLAYLEPELINQSKFNKLKER